MIVFDEEETRRQHRLDDQLRVARYWQFGHFVEPEEEPEE